LTRIHPVQVPNQVTGDRSTLSEALFVTEVYTEAMRQRCSFIVLHSTNKFLI
jgi:hypothetical protein